jgi:hypothetical protein
MKEYSVIAKSTKYYHTYIEAESLEEAELKAKETDGSEFAELEGDSSWDIINVEINND